MRKSQAVAFEEAGARSAINAFSDAFGQGVKNAVQYPQAHKNQFVCSVMNPKAPYTILYSPYPLANTIFGLFLSDILPKAVPNMVEARLKSMYISMTVESENPRFMLRSKKELI